VPAAKQEHDVQCVMCQKEAPRECYVIYYFLVRLAPAGGGTPAAQGTESRLRRRRGTDQVFTSNKEKEGCAHSGRPAPVGRMDLGPNPLEGRIL